METRIASRAFEDGLHLKREEDVVGAATLADVAKVVARELGSWYVTDDTINADVENAFEFEKSIAMVSTPDRIFQKT